LAYNLAEICRHNFRLFCDKERRADRSDAASRGSVIFFVPQGSYDLYVYYGQFVDGWNLAKSGTAFVWALNPSQQ
jgi:hypothetical protein